MHRASEWNADEGPVVILLLGVHLFSIVLAQVRLSQTLVHLREDQTLGALLGADKANHEALFDAEAEYALNVGTDNLEMHEAHHTVLEQICGDLVDVLALVLELLFQRDELTSFSLPCRTIVHERLGQDAELSASLDHIINLRFVYDRVVDLVVLTILDSCLSQTRYDSARHALLLVLSEILHSIFCQEVLSLQE